ncbi:MAG: hypothetical protein EZS28_047225 [Streblomastix strix]|uniref:Uncharacterized protein n=1 Tax=Streblomastix strix TaxID=222440 RepID=A0A5J4TGM7_9EUKA|nr:MAG: hypothetical protein EZS28_047225 [Streblomastix strix]
MSKQTGMLALAKRLWHNPTTGRVMEGMKFVHSNEYVFCTIAFDPVISEGIVRFEVIFENTRFYRSVLILIEDLYYENE